MIHRGHPLARVATWLPVVLLPLMATWAVHHAAKQRQSDLTQIREARQKVNLALAQAQHDMGIDKAARDQGSSFRSPQDSESHSAVSALGSSESPGGDRWGIPPVGPVRWIPESPYVWLPKQAFAQLPVRTFSRDGELEDSLADALALLPIDREQVRERVTDILEQQRTIELEQAKVVVHPGSGEGSLPSRLDVIIPEMGEFNASLRRDLELAFRAILGEARGQLLATLTRPWMEEQFSERTGESKLYTVLRQEQNRFEVRQSAGGSSSSACCSEDFENSVPSHLLPLFAPMKPAPPEPIRAEIRPRR